MVLRNRANRLSDLAGDRTNRNQSTTKPEALLGSCPFAVAANLLFLDRTGVVLFK